MGVFLIGEQIRQIVFDALVGRPYSPMGIMPMFCFRIDGSLLNEITVPLMPIF